MSKDFREEAGEILYFFTVNKSRKKNKTVNCEFIPVTSTGCVAKPHITYSSVQYKTVKTHKWATTLHWVTLSCSLLWTHPTHIVPLLQILNSTANLQLKIVPDWHTIYSCWSNVYQKWQYVFIYSYSWKCLCFFTIRSIFLQTVCKGLH